MHNSFHCRNRNEYPGRRLAIAPQYLVLLALCSLGVIPHHQVSAQSKPAEAGKSPLCNRDNALEMIKQQVGLTKTFEDPQRRITVLIRGADLLWRYQQDKARAVFTEAFELAIENEKENDQKAPRAMILRLQTSDQRYIVIRAVSKRDSAWANELMRQMLKAATDTEASSTRGSFENQLAAERLLDSAKKLMGTDLNSAFDFARASLNYPAGFMLTHFLYQLAEVNQQAADQFYAQALAVYGDKPMREFLYLQAYPFGWRDALNTPISSFYSVPAKFVPNQSLQRRFVQILVRRAQQALEVPLDDGDTYRTSHGTKMPGTVHLLEGLIRVEPHVRESLPDLLAPLTEAREKLLVSLSVEIQKQLLEQRAYLHTELANGLLTKSDTQTHGREVLDEAITEAKRAGTTIFAARSLLTASNLYAKIDLGRAISVLADAINCINRIEAPDFFGDDQALVKTQTRKGRAGRYQGEYTFRFYMPGLDPANAF